MVARQDRRGTAACAIKKTRSYHYGGQMTACGSQGVGAGAVSKHVAVERVTGLRKRKKAA